MILFLDFDGVLHPSSVYLRSGRPTLQGDGELFMWARILDAILADHQRPHGIRIVLSTNWVRHRGYKRTRDALPEGLRQRVIGSTYHSELTEWYDNTTRYRQITGFLGRSRIAEPWIAIDDLHEGDELADWPMADRHRLILTNPDHGISDFHAIKALREALADL